MDSSGISFTALFTGHVWYESGMSARFFTSPKGELLYRGLAPVEYVSKRTFGFNVHDMLLQRHLIMDHLIEQHIKNEGVTQILEIASGYSPRGYTLSRKFPQLHYIEADLPHMAKRKTELLAQHKGFGPHHKWWPATYLKNRARWPCNRSWPTNSAPTALPSLSPKAW